MIYCNHKKKDWVFLYFSLFIFASILFIPSAYAKRINGSATQIVANSIQFSSSSSTFNLLGNGLDITFSGLLAGSYYVYSDEQTLNNFVWYKAGAFGQKFIYGVHGTKLIIKNTTNTVRVISWKDSNITIGSYTCMPAIGGMQYTNLGDPAKTPNTVVPPNSTISINITLSHANWINSMWQMDHMAINPSDPFNVQLSMKISDENDKATYYTINSPYIIIPLNIIQKYEKN
ncbi:hypothetical protein [Pectinatus haikarae]|uniref:hypothetical protein n=1 Tax=Pectinatus haikarae TaxID=349096 RepID=UPI0018C468D4|nr:hypothetical protein [Pectinatus haikarae]